MGTICIYDIAACCIKGKVCEMRFSRMKRKKKFLGKQKKRCKNEYGI